MKKKRKAVTGPNEPKYVMAREYDIAMARSKKLLPCDHNCKTCHACIEVLDAGDRRHYSPGRKNYDD